MYAGVRSSGQAQVMYGLVSGVRFGWAKQGRSKQGRSFLVDSHCVCLFRQSSTFTAYDVYIHCQM